MQVNGFDIISDLNLEPFDDFDWDGKATSPWYRDWETDKWSAIRAKMAELGQLWCVSILGPTGA